MITPNRDSPTYCARAFHGFNQQLDHACCMINPDRRYTDYSELHGSELLLQVQHEMNEGKKPVACDHCWKTEDLGISSHRTKAINHYSSYVPTGSLVYLTLFTGNICNFACRTCSGFLTFQKRKEEQWMDENYGTHFNPRLKTYSDYSYIERMDLSHVRTISVLGGEPFLDPNHFDVIKKVAQTNKTGQVHVHYSTNGSIDVTEYYWNYLSTFEEVTVSFSIDAIGRDFEYIRTLGKWDQVHKNIQLALDLQSKVDNFNMHFHTTISSISLTGLAALNNYIQELDINVKDQVVREPVHYSFASLPNDVRSYILHTHEFGQFDSSVRRALDQIAHDAHSTSDLVNFVDRTTEFRKMDINEYIPEFKPIYEMLKTYV